MIWYQKTTGARQQSANRSTMVDTPQRIGSTQGTPCALASFASVALASSSESREVFNETPAQKTAGLVSLATSRLRAIASARSGNRKPAQLSISSREGS